MNTNAIFYQLIQALQLTPEQVKTWFAEVGVTLDDTELNGVLNNTAATALPQPLLAQLLDHWVVQLRGPKERTNETESTGETPVAVKRLSNNDVLKKLRIAYQLQESDIRELLKMVTIELTKSDLSALFRKPGQAQFKACDDELVLDFIAGLGLLLQMRAQA